MVGRTTFMIAHRLSTVRNADLILVLNHGRLVERGTHEELLGHESLYQQLHIAQTGQAQHKESLEQFERLELSIQEGSMDAGHGDTAYGASYNGSGEAEPAFRVGEPRPVPAEKDDFVPESGVRQPAESRRMARTPAPGAGPLLRLVRVRMWFIALCAIISAGLATACALVAAPQYGAKVFALVTVPALLVGLVFGVVSVLFLEYMASRRRMRTNPPSSGQQSSSNESSEP
jgi:hypothetical protein